MCRSILILIAFLLVNVCIGLQPAFVISDEVLILQTGHTNHVNQIAISPDGQLGATTSSDHTVLLWEIETGTVLRRIRDHQAPVKAVTFSPDGKHLTTGDALGKVLLWNVRDDSPGKLLADLSGVIYDLAYSPDGKVLAACGKTFSFKQWNIAAGPD